MTPSAASRWARWLFDHPRTLAIALVLSAVAGAAALPRLESAAGMEAYFQPHSPSRELLREVNERFVNDDLVFVAYRTDDPFSHRRLVELRRLGDEIDALRVQGKRGRKPGVEEVLSLATVKDLEGTADTFKAVALVAAPVPTAPAALARQRRRAHNNPLIRTNLLGDEPGVAAFVVRLDSSLAEDETAKVVDAIRDVVAAAQQRHPQTRYYVSGQPVVDADMARYQIKDLMWAIPLCYALVLLLTFLFVRRFLSLLVSSVALTLALVLGMAGLWAIGGTINNATVMIPPVVVCLSIATLLHLFSELSKHDKQPAAVGAPRRAVGGLLVPQSMAALTTAIGFASLALVRPPAVRQFGLGAAFATFVILVVMIAVFVLATRRWPVAKLVSPRAFAHSTVLERVLQLIGSITTRRPGLVVVVGLLLTAAVIIGILRLKVDMNEMEFFATDAPVRQANDFIEEHVGGTATLIVSIRGKAEDCFLQPKQLKRIEQLGRFVKAEVGARQVNSVVDFVKLAHREFLGGNAEQFRIPDTAEQSAQLLMMVGDHRLDEFINDGRDWTRVVVRMPSGSSFDLAKRIDRIERELARLFPASQGFDPAVTGRSRLGADMVTDLVISQTRSLGASFVLILILMAILFRSIPCALLASIPNALPIAANFGIMGWAGINLDASTASIAAVSLGIAVDDTIHFLRQYQLEMRRHGNPTAAVKGALSIKGPAMIWTSVVIGLGFCVLLTSSFVPTRRFGLLVCMAMAVALIADLFLLPALLLKAKRLLPWSPKESSCPRAASEQTESPSLEVESPSLEVGVEP